jgi:hypothetical protein
MDHSLWGYSEESTMVISKSKAYLADGIMQRKKNLEFQAEGRSFFK